jgi:hypothetical protein
MRRERPAQAGLTPRELARRWRISPDRVRAMILRGELQAINVSATRCGRRRYIVLPHHLAEWERTRQAGPPPATAKRKKRVVKVDFYPD